MLLETLPADEFRSNKDFVDAARNFFNSEAGRAFSAAVRSGDPMTIMAGPQNLVPAAIRDLAIAEKGNPETLLGQAKGYRGCMSFMDSLMAPVEPHTEKKRPSHSAKVAKVLADGRGQE